LYFNYPGRNDPAILVRSQAGEYYAFDQRCSHRGCSVYFDRNRRCLECPCHKGAYDAETGLVLNGPPTQPLGQIVLQMRAGGAVWAVGRRIGAREKYALDDSAPSVDFLASSEKKTAQLTSISQ
jgi:Rieske Fe-S protein